VAFSHVVDPTLSAADNPLGPRIPPTAAELSWWCGTALAGYVLWAQGTTCCLKKLLVNVGFDPFASGNRRLVA
jgi:hypothetical protein